MANYGELAEQGPLPSDVAGALYVANDQYRRAAKQLLDRLFDYDHANRCYVPRHRRIGADEMRRIMEVEA
jgi:hypothetical protein